MPTQSDTYTPPDGLPLPPADLVLFILKPHRRLDRLYKRFYESGAQIAESFRWILTRHGVDISDCEAILDFGCGAGRVIRHWKDLDNSRLYGSDYNASLVEWCRRNLPFAEFSINGLAPPLPYANDSFDFVYAFSVFTHLDSGLQRPWMAELQRVTKPNGLLLLTVHGMSHLSSLDAQQQRRFLAGELVVVRPDAAGTNECAAFHPERYIYETLARDLSVVEALPSSASKIGQDAVLLRNMPNG
jgi:SAM-dependent methyltransferase